MAISPPALFKITPVPPEDRLRFGITWLFSIVFVVFLSVYLYAAFAIQSDAAWTRVKESFGVILPALTGTLGTVIGFYFGNRNKS
jgi:hypothetical protein